MMGDNIYGGETPKDFKLKFEAVYRPLLDKEVKFYATLGNHDEPAQRFYQYFNMDGKEYYRFKKGNVAFYSLNSNYMDKRPMTGWKANWRRIIGLEDSSSIIHLIPPGGKHGSDKTAARDS